MFGTGVSHQCVFGVSFHLTQIVFANDGKSILHAWNDGFYAVVSARRESVSGASKRHVFTAVGRSGLGLHFPFSGIFTQPPLSGYGCSNPSFAFSLKFCLIA